MHFHIQIYGDLEPWFVSHLAPRGALARKLGIPSLTPTILSPLHEATEPGSSQQSPVAAAQRSGQPVANPSPSTTPRIPLFPRPSPSPLRPVGPKVAAPAPVQPLGGSTAATSPLRQHAGRLRNLGRRPSTPAPEEEDEEGSTRESSSASGSVYRGSPTPPGKDEEEEEGSEADWAGE